jgi:hypothetical protein
MMWARVVRMAMMMPATMARVRVRVGFSQFSTSVYPRPSMKVNHRMTTVLVAPVRRPKMMLAA